jgi:hypothetical protein
MRIICYLLLLLITWAPLAAQQPGPEVRAWLLNTTGATGYNGIQSNVQKVQYSEGYVYVSCTCIPGYDIGPWAMNPNIPVNQNFQFKITRTPAPNTGTAVATPLGHIGVWTNGVSIFNAKDARSYNNADVWHQNAIVVEGNGFDACLGHPAPNGEYHHHLNPRCLYNDRDSSLHSPIIGYAFDGYPVYGAYGYRNADGSGGVTRMRSSYRVRSITQRTSLPNGTALQSSQYGPAVGGQYPLGYYTEDFEYVAGLGDLDEHNGRLCVTPEYPEGTYAYFVTIDANGTAAYPYTLGPTYYGVVPPGNTGPQSGHNTPTEPVITYQTAGVDPSLPIEWGAFPNPASSHVAVTVPPVGDLWRVSLCDLMGGEVLVVPDVPYGESVTLDLHGLSGGTYFIRVASRYGSYLSKLAVAR